MKNYLIVGGIIVISLVGIWLLAAGSENPEDISTPDQSANPGVPQRFDETAASPDKTAYTSPYNPGLSFSYPQDWHITEGPDNSTAKQLVTFESPKDVNDFYFCLDMTEVDAASSLDLQSKMTDILAVDSFMATGVGKALSSVLFTVEGSTLLWSVADTTPSLSDSAFDNQITNPAGRRLQILGRFNCRESQSSEISTVQFEESLWFHQARDIVLSLSY